MTSEVEWVQQAREGDQAAFGQLVRAYGTPVYNLSYRMLGSAGEAEEAAQETFLRVFTNLHRFDPNRRFKSWILSIASHYCIDRLRRRRISWVSLDSDSTSPKWLESDSPNPEHEVIQRQEEERIQRMLSELSPVDRAAVTLRYWYDYSYSEISDALDLTESAVKSRLHRARRKMAGMLKGNQDDTSQADQSVDVGKTGQ